MLQLLIVIVHLCTQATTLKLYDSVMVDSQLKMKIFVWVNTKTDKADIYFMGSFIPHDLQIELFDSYTVMVNVVVSDTNETSILLSEQSNGVTLQPMLKLVDHSYVDQHNVELLKLRRDRIGISSAHHNFPNTNNTDVNIRWLFKNPGAKTRWLFKNRSFERKGEKKLCIRTWNKNGTNCIRQGYKCNSDEHCCSKYTMECKGGKCIRIPDWKFKQFWIYWIFTIGNAMFTFLLWFSIIQELVTGVVLLLLCYMRIKGIKLCDETLLVLF